MLTRELGSQVAFLVPPALPRQAGTQIRRGDGALRKSPECQRAFVQLDDSDSQGHLLSSLQFWALPTAFSLDFDLLKRALWANWHSLVIRFYASSEQPGVLGLGRSCRRTD